MKNDPQSFDQFGEEETDPSFDLRRGLVILVIVISLMVVVTLICIYLADR